MKVLEKPILHQDFFPNGEAIWSVEFTGFNVKAEESVVCTNENEARKLTNIIVDNYTPKSKEE